MAWGCSWDKLVLRHFLNASHGVLFVEDFEMLNDFMPFRYPLGLYIGASLRYVLRYTTCALHARWCC
jgi:hypothetical protein